jgi:hypothetical protein
LLEEELTTRTKSGDQSSKEYAFVMWEVSKLKSRYTSDSSSWKVDEFLDRVNNLSKLMLVPFFSRETRSKQKSFPILLLRKMDSILSKRLKDYKERDRMKILLGFLLLPLKKKIDQELKSKPGYRI